LTLIFFFILIGLSFGADKYKGRQDEKNSLVSGEDDVAHAYVEFKPLEIYRELAAEKAGTAST
jgi:hypothetical protein